MKYDQPKLNVLTDHVGMFERNVPVQRWRAIALLMLGLISIISASEVKAQNAKPAAAWPYPQSLEAVKAAPKNHYVRYEDEHVRLLEVTIRPGETENWHGHQYPAVFVFDNADDSQGSNAFQNPNDPLNNDAFKAGGKGDAPAGLQYPTCMTLGPEAPHAWTQRDTYPSHFYRLEFKRLDGDGIKTHWKEWYPWMLEPLKSVKDLVPGPALGKPLSKEWPYPLAYESVKADGNNHYVRYEDDHLRLLEVVIRPGETENVHGHQYPSVSAVDAPTPSEGGNVFLDPKDSLNSDDKKQGHGPAPKGMRYPTCSTALPEAPHAANNLGTYPAHWYRIEFKRIDGDGIKTKWKQWYPWMTQATAAGK